MQGIAIKPKAHQHGINSQFLLEESDDRNAASIPGRDGRLTPNFFKSLAGCLVRRRVSRRYNRFTTVLWGHHYRNILWSDVLEMLGKQGCDLLAFLIRNESHRNFRERL